MKIESENAWRIDYVDSCIAVVLSVSEGIATIAHSEHSACYIFATKSARRRGSTSSLLLNVFVKRYTSSDLENKIIFKAGTSADAGARKF